MISFFRKYTENFSDSKYVLFMNLADRLFTFIYVLILARIFSEEIFGQVVTLLTASAIFILLIDFGLPVYLQRSIAMNSDYRTEDFSRVFFMSLILLPFYLFANFIFYKALYFEIPLTLFSLISAIILVSFLVNLFNKSLSGLNHFREQFIAFIIPRALIILSFLVCMIYKPSGINRFMIIMLSGFFLNFILIFHYAKRDGLRISQKYFEPKEFLNIFKLSLPLGLAVIFNFLYDKVDVVLISNLRDYTEVAFYNVGYGIFKASTITFSFLLVAGFTKISLLNKDKTAVSNYLSENTKLILSICIPVSVLLFFLAQFIITILYTEKFLSSVTVLKILSPGVIAIGLNNLTGIILNGMGYFKTVMYITLYALIANVVLNIFFIPQYGIIAASVITVATEYFIFITEYYYLRKILRR